MFDFVRLPNPIERLEFDWVRLVFCSVLFDWIGRAKGHQLNFSVSEESVSRFYFHSISYVGQIFIIFGEKNRNIWRFFVVYWRNFNLNPTSGLSVTNFHSFVAQSRMVSFKNPTQRISERKWNTVGVELEWKWWKSTNVTISYEQKCHFKWEKLTFTLIR